MTTLGIQNLEGVDLNCSRETEGLGETETRTGWSGRCSEERSDRQKEREQGRTPNEISISEFWDYVQKRALDIRSRGQA